MRYEGELDEASNSLIERLLLIVCRFNFILYIALVLESMLLLLATLSLLFGSLDSESELILRLDFALLAIVMIPTVGGIVFCKRR